MDRKNNNNFRPTLILTTRARLLFETLLTIFICLSVFFLFSVCHHFAASRRFSGGYWKKKKNHVGFCKEAWTHCLGASPCEAQFAPIKLEIFNLEQASCLAPTFCKRNKINQHIFKILKNHWLKVMEIAKIFKKQKRILYL